MYSNRGRAGQSTSSRLRMCRIEHIFPTLIIVSALKNLKNAMKFGGKLIVTDN